MRELSSSVGSGTWLVQLRSATARTEDGPAGCAPAACASAHSPTGAAHYCSPRRRSDRRSRISTNSMSASTICISMHVALTLRGRLDLRPEIGQGTFSS